MNPQPRIDPKLAWALPRQRPCAFFRVPKHILLSHLRPSSQSLSSKHAAPNLARGGGAFLVGDQHRFSTHLKPSAHPNSGTQASRSTGHGSFVLRLTRVLTRRA